MTEKENAKGLTEKLAEFIVRTDDVFIPEETRENAKIAFLDWLGCALVGVDSPVVERLIRYADVTGGKEQATILGKSMKKSVLQAALINGAASHVMDFDDTTTVDIRHASVGMVSALLALSEWRNMTGKELLTAYIIGFKLAMVMGTLAGRKQYDGGWHTTSTIGRFASAAGCARLLGLNEQETVFALGLAGTMSSGMKIVFGTMTKAFHAGNAARDGMKAALLGEVGMTCSPDFLEGPDGYLQVFSGTIDEDVLSSLGVAWDFDKLAQKYHASCHFTHSAIEATLKLVAQEGLGPEDIESIVVHASRLGFNAAGKTSPKTALEGKFSIPYCVANAILRGDTGLKAFSDEKVIEPIVTDYMKKIDLVCDSNFTAMEARVDITTIQGKRVSDFRDVYTEIPSLAEKKERITKKFMNICDMIMEERKARAILDSVLNIENVKVGTIIQQICV